MTDPGRVKESSAVATRLAGIPLGRFADPSEIAVAALALAELETPNLLIFASTGGEVLY
jgi:NAD(P)-dependent dehydrogenase (short-subunit alcohol dehydrogenase family)